MKFQTDLGRKLVQICMYTIDGQDNLIIVDYFSNFWEIDLLHDTKASTVIKKLKCHFARHGIPDIVMSDNGLQFACEKFGNFANEWGVEPRPGSPGDQQTNGNAEEAVKEAKCLLRNAKASRGDLYLAVLAQRNTPTESMGTSPTKQLLGRRCMTQLSTTKELLKPQSAGTEVVKKKIRAQQERQAKYYNKRARDLSPLVWMRPFTLGKKVWEKAMVTKRLDERSYEVETQAGIYQRNRVDLKEQSLPRPLEQNPTLAVTPDKEKTSPSMPPETPAANQPPSEQKTTLSPVSQRPKRNTKEPEYLKDYVH